MTNVEVAVLLKIAPKTVSEYVREWQTEHGQLLPRRGTIHDMGPTLTHKETIIRKLFLEGKSVEQVCRETHHSPEAIHRYIRAFRQVLLLRRNELHPVEIAFDEFAEGFGFHQGAEEIGASVIPASLTTSVPRQIVVMRDFKTTVLISTPSHALNIAAGLNEAQVHPERLCLRLGLFGGERWSERLRRQLEERLRITAIDTYGPTEVMGPGVAGECHLRQGLHINEDHFIVEIIDPKTLAPVPAGDEGELVLTTISKEGFPLIRYRTGDITRINPEPCPCGRTFVRVARVMARTDDLILFQAVGFFPAQIEEILGEFEGTSPYYQIVLDQEGGVETLQIRVEISGQIPCLDEVKTLEALQTQVAKRIKSALDVEARVILVEPGSLRQLANGTERVVDRRPG